MKEQTNTENLRCAYCGKVRPKSEMKQGEIIFRNRNSRTGKSFIDRKTNNYCKDMPCHVYDQMSHEG